MIKGVKKLVDVNEEIIRTVKNCPNTYDDKERVLLIDADSIMYFATYFPEDSLLEFVTEEDQLEEAKFRVRNKLQEIQNNVEEWFNIKNTYIFIGGKNNFRYKVFPEYKANRTNVEKSPLLPMIKDYMLEELNAIASHGAEADDYLYDAMVLSEGNCVVSSIDKDVFYNSPEVPFYNYRSYNDVLGEFKSISKEESRLYIVSQIIIGDSSDGVPGAYGIGEAYCKKNLKLGMTNYQFIKEVLKAYLKANKGDVVEAKKQIRLYYTVLKLYTHQELNNYIKIWK